MKKTVYRISKFDRIQFKIHGFKYTDNMVLYKNDTDYDVIETFKTKEEGMKALSNYRSYIEYIGDYAYVTQFYLEEITYEPEEDYTIDELDWEEHGFWEFAPLNIEKFEDERLKK